MKSAGKARNNGLYRHIRTSKEIIRNLLNDSLNHIADGGKITIHTGVWKTHDFNGHSIKVKRSLCITIMLMNILVMLRSIQFDSQFCCMAVKINDASSNGLLPLKTNGIIFQKVIPEMTFLRCHFLAKCFSLGNQSFLIREGHGKAFLSLCIFDYTKSLPQ